MRYQDKVVVITGGSRGLGLVMARELASLGARIAIVARDAGELSRAQSDLESFGSTVHSQVCDVTDQAAVDAAFAEISSALGPIDVLVNNAGVIQVGPLKEQTQKDFEDAMQIHGAYGYMTEGEIEREMRDSMASRIYSGTTEIQRNLIANRILELPNE